MAPVRLSFIAVLVVACNGPDATSSGFTMSGGTPPAGTSSGESSSTTDGSSSTSGSSSGSSSTSGSSGTSTTDTPFPDMGTPPDFGGPMGCKGKIDFLFVISRDGVMKPSQDKLVAAVPQFISTIQDEFDEFDLHIMVVDSEERWWVEDCEFNQCPAPCDVDPNYPCGYWPTDCDKTLGAGTIFNAGPNTLDIPCELGGLRYITKDTPDIPTAFECIARVGTWGNNMMGDAMLGAISPQLNATEPPGCNAGFLRDDALLVLTVIGPDDYPGVGGSAAAKWQEWRQALVDAKNGDEEAIVALGIISDQTCQPNVDPGYRFCNLIPSFPNSILENFTLEDFSEPFDKAAGLALDACSVFVPG